MFNQVTRNLRFIDDVAASVKEFGQTVAASFVRLVSPYLKEGDELSAEDVTRVQTGIVRLLEGREAEVRAAEKAHRIELRKEKTIRTRRNREKTLLYNALLKLRKVFEGFGAGTAEAVLGLDPGIATANAKVLSRYARETLEVLFKPDFALPPEAARPETFNPLEHAEEIGPLVDQLELTLTELARQKRRSQECLKVKTRLLEATKTLLVHGSRLLEGLYVVSGEEFHAVRLRPRLGGRTGSDPEPAPDPDDPDDGEPDTPEETSPPQETPSAPTA
ncbi:MAG TPA: hypothetical protein VGG06_08290 [Thermoanaerobaculia bacterium]|jgi:hypothetical protein